jgi:hypothetical protein
MVYLLTGPTLYLADASISATPDIIHQAQFALDLKAKVLPLYEKVFDIEYKLPKLDTLIVSCNASTQLFEFDADLTRRVTLTQVSSSIVTLLILTSG